MSKPDQGRKISFIPIILDWIIKPGSSLCKLPVQYAQVLVLCGFVLMCKEGKQFLLFLNYFERILNEKCLAVHSKIKIQIREGKILF